MAEFKIGDVVRLKSSGPRMTVRYVGRDDNIGCTWFNSQGPNMFEVKQETFPKDALMHLKE